jgi:hypothetical protein
VVPLLAVAAALTRVASLLVRAANVPFEAVAHLRSVAGLFARAGAPGDVVVAAQLAVDERMCSTQAALALMVSVGPVVALKPASKSEGVGDVSAVDAALICKRTTRPAVMDTLPGTPQLAGAPDAVHCAYAVVDGVVMQSNMKPTALRNRIIGSAFRF